MKIFLIIWAIFFYLSSVEAQKYTVCARKKHAEDCEQLQRHSNIKCGRVANEATCLTKIEAGEIDFGSVDAETVFLARKLTSKIIPIATTSPETEIEKFKYETVIVTNEPIKSLDELKGMSYCHPGFDKTDIPPLLLKEFEMRIMKHASCDSDFPTITERYLHALHEFFGPSCRPGQWVADKELDKELKQKYPKLIELCPKFELIGSTELEKSLNCMLHTPKAISLTTLTTVNERKNDTKLYYLCKNETTSNDICVWSKQPYRFLVTNNNENNNNLAAEIKEWFSASLDPENKEHNQSRVQLSDMEVKHTKQILDILGDIEMKLSPVNDQRETLDNFLKDFRDTHTQDDWKLCKRSLKWCTISDAEQEKCKWLSQASINYGIQPIVNCVQKSSELECIQSINKNSEEADLITIPANYGYAAKKHDLAAIAFPETSSSQEVNTLLLVKGENITRLENLKGKKGCFPVYSGIAWLSFVNTTRGIVLPTDSCDYGKLLSDLLGDSCMPGAMESKRAIQNNVDATKMCKLCTDSGRTCDANEGTNWYYNTSGALLCLEQRGDFAVIVKDKSVLLPNNVRVMCRNGTLSTLDGVDVDEGCYLSVLTTSEVVTRRDDPNNKDIQLALIEYDRWFASETHTPFRLFDSFNGTKDLLFKDSTPGLDLPSSEKKAIKNYVDVFRHIDACAGGGTSSPQGGTASIAFLTTSLMLTSLSIAYFL